MIKIENKKTVEREGRCEKGDKPQSIEIVQIVKPNVLLFQVEWKQSERSRDRIVLKPTIYTNMELRKYEPEMLLDYYESRLRPC